MAPRTSKGLLLPSFQRFLLALSTLQSDTFDPSWRRKAPLHPFYIQGGPFSLPFVRLRESGLNAECSGVLQTAMTAPMFTVLRREQIPDESLKPPDMVQGKRVLVTGSSTGIGEQIAYEFARMGAHLIITARREKQLKEVRTPRECNPKWGKKQNLWVPFKHHFPSHHQRAPEWLPH